MNVDVLILANKWWEVVALVSVLEHGRKIKPEFSATPLPFEILTRRLPRNRTVGARLTCCVNERVVEVWCLEDLVSSEEGSSSSIAKIDALRLFIGDKRFESALLIAFGTAASPQSGQAGSVVVGSSVFVFNAQDGVPSSAIETIEDGIGRIVNSDAGAMLDERVFDESLQEAQKRFVFPPNNPAPAAEVIAASNAVAVGVVNVASNRSYKEYDVLALKQFDAMSGDREAHSVETTHGLIRLCLDNPFLYVSGIVNQVGQIVEEFHSNRYAQSFAASHNAAICAAWMLPAITAHWFGEAERTG